MAVLMVVGVAVYGQITAWQDENARLERQAAREAAAAAASTTTAAPKTTAAPTTTRPATTTPPPPTSTRAPTTTRPPRPTAPPTTLPPITPEELALALSEPARTWLLAPSGPGFDTLAAAAGTILESGRRLPAHPEGGVEETETRLRTLQTYPGEDFFAAIAIDRLSVFLVDLPAIVTGGSHVVGQTIQPGTYRTLGPVEDCYWETLDPAGEINDNNFVSAAPQVIMTVRSSDFAVNFERCGMWVQID
jgi:type II secretory pathway pseudopilin PulG